MSRKTSRNTGSPAPSPASSPATTSTAGTVQLADAAAMTAKTPGRVVTADLMPAAPLPATAAPLVDAATASIGTSDNYAREDHSHPTDTSRASGVSLTAEVTRATTAEGLKADKATTLTAGDGLTGGGDLSANRSLAVQLDPTTDAALTVGAAGLKLELLGSNVNPLAAGIAAPGTGTAYSREDHVHPDSTQPWIPTTNNMTLAVGSQYILQAGHTVTFPTGSIGDSILMVPANGDWSTLGATLTPASGWTIGTGQSAIPATSDMATFAVNAAANWLVAVGGASAPPVATVLSNLHGTLSADYATNIGAGEHIKFNTVQFTRGGNITLDTASAYSSANNTASIGRITISGAGRNIRLVGSTLFEQNATTWAEFTWFNADTGVMLPGNAGFSWSPSHTSHVPSQPSAVATFTTTAATTRVELRLTGTNGLSSVKASAFVRPHTFFTADEML